MNKREEKEQRLFGALALITRNTKKGREVLLINDEAKKEVPAGLQEWFTAIGNAFCYPGGGRGVTESGELETREQTLQQEIEEEMGLLLSLDLLSQGQIQKHPFLVGQIKPKLIHQIGVTSALYSIDQLGQSEQRYIEEYILQEKARWNSFEQLFKKYILLLYKVNNSVNTIRPQVFTTAFLWHLDINQQWSNEAIMIKIDELNRITRSFLVAQSRLLSVPIKNGAFDEQGNALHSSELSTQDSRFIYGK